MHYRALQEDAVDAAVAALRLEVIGHTGLRDGEPAQKLLQNALVEYVKERLDLPAFSITGQIRTGVFDAAWWRNERRSWGHCPLTYTALVRLVQSTLDAVLPGIHAIEGRAEEVWQRLTIPVDIPAVDYVNAVTLNIASPFLPLPQERAQAVNRSPVINLPSLLVNLSNLPSPSTPQLNGLLTLRLFL